MTGEYDAVSELAAGDRSRAVRAGPIVLAAFIGFLLGQIVGALFESLAASIDHYPGGASAAAAAASPPWWFNSAGLVGLWIGFGAAVVYAYTDGGLRATGLWRVGPRDVGYLLLGIVAQFVVDLAYAPFHLTSLNQPVNKLLGGPHTAGFAVVSILTVVFAPYAEEWLFRGTLFRALLAGTTSFGERASRWTAIAASAVLFGLAHGEWVQLPGLVALGVVLAWLVARTGRLSPGYLVHVGFNATALAAVLTHHVGH